MANRGVELAVAYLTLIPEMRNVAPSVRRGLAGVDGEARNAGKSFGQMFSKSASDAADVSSLGKKTSAAAAQASRASRDLTAARKLERDAAQSLGIAEAKLAELREKGTAKTSQLLAAEQKVDRARESSARAQQKVAAAYDAEFTAKGKSIALSRQHADATTRSSQKVGAATGVFQRLGVQLRQTEGQLESNRAAMQRLAGKTGVGGLVAIGPTIKTALVGGLGAVAASAVKLEAEFGRTMNLVAAATGLGAAEMQRMDALAIKLGRDTSFSAGEAASAMLALAKAGVKPATIETGALSATLMQAAASGDDLESSANAIGNALNMFSLKGEDAAKVAAAFAGGANASTAEVSDLTLGLSQVGPGAAAFGMSINEVVGTLAAFNNAGVKGQDAGTSLKTLLTSLVPSSKSAAKAMESLGLYTEEAGSAFFNSNGSMKSATEIAGLLQGATKGLTDEERTLAFTRIFGSDASRAANILAKEGAKGLAVYVKATQNASAAQDMANAQMKGTAGALERLSGSWETLRLQIGQALAPAVVAGSAVLAAAMGFLGDKLDVILPTLGALVSTFALYKAGVMASVAWTQLQAAWTARQTIAQWALNAAMNANAVGLIVVGIAALVAGMILLYKRSETVRNIIAALGRAFVTAGEFIAEVFGAAVSGVVTLWGNFTSALSTGWEWLVSNVFNPIRDTVTTVMGTAFRFFYMVVRNVWEAVSVTIINAWKIISAIFGLLADWLGPIFSRWFAVFRGVVLAVWTAVRNTISTVWNFILTRVFTPIRTWLTAVFVAAFNAFSALINRVWTAVRNAISTVWNFLLSRVFTPIRNWLGPIFTGVFNTFRNVATAAWERVRSALAAGWAWIDSRVLTPFRNGLTRLRDWFGTVVAGIQRAWEALKDTVRKPVEFVVNTVLRDGLFKAWDLIATKVGLQPYNFTGMAVGGRVPGWSPNDTADNIPAWLTADEEVIRRRSAKRMRRRHPGVLEYINQHGTLPGYADGGRVGYASGGMVINSMAAWLRKYLPGVRITSSYRPGAGRSYHASGRALDISPSMAAFNAIRSAFGPSIAELIYAPAGGRNVWHGRPHNYSAGTLADHYDHVHWAMFGPVGNIAPGDASLLSLDDPLIAGPNLIAEGLKGLISPLFSGARKLVDGITGMFGNTELVTMLGRFAKSPIDAVEKWLREKIDAVFPAVLGEVVDNQLGDAADLTGGSVKSIVQQAAARRGWGAGPNWDALQWIIQRESGWNPNAQNPTSTAYGLFQFLNGTWGSVGARKTSDPAAQALAGMAYIKQRYGTPANARAFWQRNGWYGEGGTVVPSKQIDHVEVMDSGGILRPGVSLVHNYTGRPETVRTWDQERSLGRGGTNITINGIRYDSVGEFASELNFALTRASARSRYAEVG